MTRAFIPVTVEFSGTSSSTTEPGSDHGVVSDRHRAQYFGSGSDQNIVAYCGMTFRMLLAAGSAQRHLVINRAVISDYSRFTDYNTVSMVDK